MTTTIQKIDGQIGVILSQDILEELGVREGDQVILTKSEKGVVIKKNDDSFANWADAYRQCKIQYDNTLQELAK